MKKILNVGLIAAVTLWMGYAVSAQWTVYKNVTMLLKLDDPSRRSLESSNQAFVAQRTCEE